MGMRWKWPQKGLRWTLETGDNFVSFEFLGQQMLCHALGEISWLIWLRNITQVWWNRKLEKHSFLLSYESAMLFQNGRKTNLVPFGSVRFFCCKEANRKTSWSEVQKQNVMNIGGLLRNKHDFEKSKLKWIEIRRTFTNLWICRCMIGSKGYLWS